jgi:excinuclease ABC, A subunit
VPDEELSLNQGAVIVWNSNFKYHRHLLEALAKELGFSMDTPWKDLPKKVKDAILNGRNYEVKVKFRNRWGRERSYTTGFEGALTYIQRKKEETESQLVVDRMDSYMREVPCSACHGARLRPEVLAVTIGDLSIAQLSDLSISDAKDFLDSVTLEERSSVIAAPILTEIQARLNFLVDVGLSYLTLSRGAATLSGGEAQRIRLATQIGSGLVGVLYVLDEPSIGLHQRDNRKLIATLEHLRDLGNTLIVVEHDEETIEAADWIVDVGPGAGENGGWIVHSGTLEELKENKRSLTGQYLSGKRSIVIPQSRRERDPKRQITVKGARENNLKDVTVSFPLSTFTAVTGVSGSGKSTLVNQILYRSLASRLNGARLVPGRHRSVVGTDGLDKVVHVDQSPIGRTPRSNPATYTGVWDQIRKLFAEVPEAKLRGYGPGRFSFNVKGGRCESCKGDGTLKIEMNFLPDVYVPCEVCHGARYNRETLEILYKGKSVADVLNMPIAEAAEFFAPISRIARHLNTLVEVGLGYVRLGQAATTLSGGEAQRVKLASELQRRSTGRTVYVLDEPTTGLHTEDIRKLLLVLQSLVDKGNTVIVIEHNLDVIKSADWVIDMGPEGGSGGGTVVAEGTPEEVAKVHESFTGQFLAEIFEASAQHRAKSK